MGKEEEIKTCLMQSIIVEARTKHKDVIDKAYEYFWDEHSPDEFLGGTALELGFINFEDWLLFDYKVDGGENTLIDVYVKEHSELTSEQTEVINKIKHAFLSLYEVTSVAGDEKILLQDLLLGEEVILTDKTLTRGLKQADIFAARLLPLDGKHVMSCCVYPFTREKRETVLSHIDKQFARYKRNVTAEGTIKDYLKAYGDIFNLIWMQFMLNPQHGKS